MKIGHFYTFYDDGGGVPMECRLLVKNLAELGHEVIVYTLKRGSNSGDEGSFGRIIIKRYKKENKLPFFIPPRLKKEISINYDNIDIMHIHGGFITENVQVAKAAIKGGIPYVITPYGQLNQPAFFGRGWIKKRLYIRLILNGVMRRAKGVQAFSETEKKILQTYTGGNNIFIAPLGLWPGVPEKADPGYLERANPDLSGKLKFLFLGRLEYRLKGLDLLFRAVAEIKKKGKGSSFVLVLIGPDWEGGRVKLEKLAKKLDITDNIVFSGFIEEENKYDALSGGNCLVMSSRWEGFPRAVREFLAVRGPVIVTKETNIADWIKEYRAGLVVELEAASIAAAVISILDNPELLDSMKPGAELLSREIFNWKNIAFKLCEVYSEN